MSQPKRTIVTVVLSVFVGSFCLGASAAFAEVRLPNVIGSNMVVQRDRPIPMWGWAEPGEPVTVELANHQLGTTADSEGKWIVKLPAMKAGGPYKMTVRGRNSIELTNILVGEVWICSGQSNMQWPVERAANAEQEIAAADYPKIRLFTVQRDTSGQPLDDCDGSWSPCSAQTISDFSAVAYFFGRELHRQLSVPIGLIDSSWGGTRIEPWTPPDGFASVPKLEDIHKQIGRAHTAYRQAVTDSLDPIEAWIQAARKALAADRSVPPEPRWPKHLLSSHREPTGLYNAMIHPLVPFAIRGAIWYQGESNRGEDMMYYEKMKALIAGWRKVWGQGDFPFYFVQLAPYRYGGDLLQLPGIWEAQTAALSLTNTGMAVTVDIGNVSDIHPKNKQDVGKRLSLWALAKTYGRKDLVYCGPLYESISIEGQKVRISFQHVGGGLASRDGKPLTWFEIAGGDKKFVKAETKIDGDTVVVSSEAVTAPVAVRFGWHQEAEPNLANKEGLPAAPFRTDRW